MSKNLTTGKPVSVIAGLWSSVVVGSALMQAYSILSGVITGHFLGINALGGISAASIITTLTNGTLNSLMRGFTVPMSKAFGAGDFSRMRKLLWPGILLGMILSVVTTVLLLPFGDTILHVMQTPEENFIHASRYIFASLLAMPPCVLFNTLFYVCHATGNGKLASFVQVIVALATIFFDALLLIILKWGAEGAAYATLFSNALGSALCLWLLLRQNSQLIPQKGDFRIHFSACRSLFGNGISNSASSLLMQFASTVLQTAVNSMGAAYVNAYAIANKLFNLLSFPIASMDHTMHDYLCHNAGAMKWKRIHEGYRGAARVIAACIAFFLLVGTLLTEQLITLLVGTPEAELVALVRQFLLIVGICNVFYGTSVIYRYTPPALGHPGSMAITGGLECAGRLLACLIVYRWGFIGACLLLPFGWVSRGVYDVTASYIYLRKAKRTIPDASEPGK